MHRSDIDDAWDGTLSLMYFALVAGASLAGLEELDALPADATGQPPPDEGVDDDQPAVGLRTRAYPLLQMLDAAAREHCDVMWEAD